MTEVAIVGGGVVGTSVAAHLGESGLDVTLYEKGELGGATTAASMAIFMWSGERVVADSIGRAWGEYRSLLEAGTLSFTKSGFLDVAETEAHHETLREKRAALDGIGREAHLLSPAAVADHGLDPAAVEGALYAPDDGYLEADEVVAHYVRRAREAGVAVETGATVTDVAVADGAVTGVAVDAESRAADVVVNAAGPWAPQVNALAGVSLPLRHTRGPILALDADDPHRLPAVRFERGTYARPFGTSGAYVGHYTVDFDAADVLDTEEPREIGDRFRRQARETVATFLPSLADAEAVDRWVGLRTVTPDGLPLVGETSVGGFHVAAGMTGEGVTLAPAVGQFVAERLRSGSTPSAARHFSPARFDD